MDARWCVQDWEMPCYRAPKLKRRIVLSCFWLWRSCMPWCGSSFKAQEVKQRIKYISINSKCSATRKILSRVFHTWKDRDSLPPPAFHTNAHLWQNASHWDSLSPAGHMIVLMINLRFGWPRAGWYIPFQTCFNYNCIYIVPTLRNTVSGTTHKNVVITFFLLNCILTFVYVLSWTDKLIACQLFGKVPLMALHVSHCPTCGKPYMAFI